MVAAKTSAAEWSDLGRSTSSWAGDLFRLTSGQIKMDPGSFRGPATDIPAKWYPGRRGLGKFAYYQPTAAKPANETMMIDMRGGSRVVGWYGPVP